MMWIWEWKDSTCSRFKLSAFSLRVRVWTFPLEARLAAWLRAPQDELKAETLIAKS